MCSTNSERGHGEENGVFFIKVKFPVFQLVPVSCDNITEQKIGSGSMQQAELADTANIFPLKKIHD